jgi:nucleoid DNA-binding protein
MSEKITFKQLVELIAAQSEQSQSSTNSFIGELVQIIESGLQDTGSVSISGFGKFELRWMKERPGVNPQTGEKITIPGQNRIVFKPYKNLREQVNRPYAQMAAQVLTGDDQKEPSSSADTPPPSSAATEGISLTPEEPADDDNDWVVERPKPSPKADEPVSGKEDEAEPVQEKATPAAVTLSSQPEEELFDPFENHSDEVIINKVEESGQFRWSYAAAAMILLIALLALFLLMQRPQTEMEPAAPAPQEQLDEPAEETETVQPEEPAPEPESPPPQGDLPDFPFEIDEINIDAGESLWSIAESRLGNPYLWPLIYELNRERIDNPNVVIAGNDLQIPVVEDPQELTETQREQVALGYLSVYEWMTGHQPDNARYFLWAAGVFSMDTLYSAEVRVDRQDWEFATQR